MNLQHLNVKIFVDGPLQVDMGEFINTFHRWVAEQTTAELLIDVADYRHVPAGPGVVLVGLEADYAVDHADDRAGLLYNRKAPLAGSPGERLHQAVTAAIAACEQLESEFDNLKFDRSQLEISINDRALAPNTAQTLAEFQPVLTGYLQEQHGQGDCELTHDSRDPRRRFTVAVKLAQPLA